MNGEFLVGQFVAKCGALTATDPCYTHGGGVILNDVKKGLFNVFSAYEDSHTNAFIKIVHSEFPEHILVWELFGDTVGVDSGQAGFFDLKSYNKKIDNDKHDEFYDKVCAITLSGQGVGCLKKGCVSSSGYGDGSYDLFIARNVHGEIVAAKIDFVCEDEGNEEEEMECDEEA